ncbi:MAG: glutamate--tRNA ligase [Flavobacteriaceae bacterium]
MSVRVRFAPSPTGPLHIGGLRTALYNYLLAKQKGGAFVLRIEDTDQNRYVEGAEEYIQQTLAWAGIPPDESPKHPGRFGPYRQSERLSIYGKYVNQLLEQGSAYYAFDSAEDLEKERQKAAENNNRFSYDCHTRMTMRNSLTLDGETVAKLLEEGASYVVRFKMEADRTLTIHDEVRQNVTVNTTTLDDKVLFKSDGMPTYHLANVVDDHLMEITDVIRGEEWLPSLPLHFLLYEAFGWNPPKFAHLPLILKPNGKGKLSKRDGEAGGFPVYPLEWSGIKGFKEDGYLPVPLLNFLALLGWSNKSDEEVLDLQEMIKAFSMDGIQKAGARFDIEKLRWFNQQHLQKMNDEALLEECVSGATELQEVSKEHLKKALVLVKERLIFPADLNTEHGYFFNAPTTYDEKAVGKQWKEETPSLLESFVALAQSTSFEESALEECLKGFVGSKEIGIGKVMAPLRIALVGSLKGPSVYSLMAFLGKEEVVQRINRALSHITS